MDDIHFVSTGGRGYGKSYAIHQFLNQHYGKSQAIEAEFKVISDVVEP